MRVLIINSGSSSLKFALFDMAREAVLLSGTVERIGEADSNSIFRAYLASGAVVEDIQHLPVADHPAGLQQVLAYIEVQHPQAMQSLHGIGHRVVHGGERFQAATLIDAEVLLQIAEMVPLAPLHNPANLAGIEAMRRLCPQLPQVAVFDTAFFRTLPAHAYRYALPDALYQDHQVRRYGFHGSSHQYISRRAAEYLQPQQNSLRFITLHLGNGASVAAIRDGICIDTSMGMTPLAGLMMGTRCGDLDPAVHFYLGRTLGLGLDQIETLLNQNSGMKGLCGVSDMREVHRLADQGDERARLAIEMYCYQIYKYIGAYYVALGGLDALVFSGGIGENDSVIRQLICNKLSVLGVSIKQPPGSRDKTKKFLNKSFRRMPESSNHQITLDSSLRRSDKNNINQSFPDTIDISAENSKVKVLVIQTNEELEIARQTVAVINKHNPP